MRRPLPAGNVPMMTETQRLLALQLRMAVEAIIGAPSVDTFNTLSKIFAALCACGMVGDAIDLATDTMCVICDRYERVQRIGVKECEATALRLAADGIDARLSMIPINKLRHAIAEVEIFCASVGA